MRCANPSVSSEVKGETEDDTVRVLAQYFHLIIIATSY